MSPASEPTTRCGNNLAVSAPTTETKAVNLSIKKKRYGQLPRPSDSSTTLTAWVTDDLEAEPWVTLHEERLPYPPSSFWYVVDLVTVHQHWNRTIYSQCLVDSEHVDMDTGETITSSAGGGTYTAPPPKRTRVNTLRNLYRKTPAPIGGDEHTEGRSYEVREWTSQWIINHMDEQEKPQEERKENEQHVACFGLCIPEQLVTADNPRALRFWPFQYPKARAYRYIYSIDPDSDSDSKQYILKYQVVPLGDEVKYPRQFEHLMLHGRPAAVKMVAHFRKRMMHYDERLGASTYVKRVTHDNLISERRFRKWYDEMKVRHAPKIREWCETPDLMLLKPYEELSIAAYLCALWEAEREEEEEESIIEEISEIEISSKPTSMKKRKQTFIDVGCGNGLLTYLLLEEGHVGIGVDLQTRPIWSLYPEHVQKALRHEQMDPRTYDCSSYDWIVSNHADELSPWVPVMAARAQLALSKRRIIPSSSSPSTLHKLDQQQQNQIRRARPRFFLLPCCFYDFDGKKVAFGHTRRTIGVNAPHGMGKYEAYYRWIEAIMRAFGFTVEYENLRIPSTKYVCLFGRFVEHELRISEEVIRETSALVLLDAKQSRMK